MAMQTVRIEEVMTTAIRTVPEGATVREVAHLMKTHQIGDVLVTDADGKLCGILTDRDLVVRALAEGREPDATRAAEICSKDQLVTVAPDATVDETVQLMREHAVRRIPVVQGDNAVGIVSLGDLARERDPQSALGRISGAPPNT